ncbi:FkbM family methyltransferase [Amylibacter sp. SFDW26]|uniref:FkbM family methyltransferase n=1 Tax=Amylibacter sp. SFDW26 TaxID=2652722 RepID=UPI001869822F|nr:FkbM family methyltransferase [Amylibacter sp. SFDW26]
MYDYDEVIVTSGIKTPFIPHIITPKIEKPMRNNRYEKGKLKGLQSALKPGDNVLELGGGIGLISTAAAQVKGVSKVTTIEANPKIIPVIHETHRLNDVQGVDLRSGVVSSGPAQDVDFYIRKDFWASSMEPDSRAYESVEKLPNFDIRELVNEIKPNVIICDIEGAELGLFDKVDLSKVRILILQVHPKVYGQENLLSIMNMLMHKGFSIIPEKKPSSVWRFERATQNISAPSEPELSTLEVIKPQLDFPKKSWNDSDPKVMISTCMKDEGPFILEWIAWHKSIGINNIVVFSNDCTDGTDLILDRLHAMGLVHHMPNPAAVYGRPDFQPIALAYTPHFNEFKTSDFYISMDVDEFINIRHGTGKITDLLKATGPFDALSISELNHGSNQKEDYERGFVTELFEKHQRERPGKPRSLRGVKTLVNLNDKLRQIRNHRPDLHKDRGDVTWLNGSSQPIDIFHEQDDKNGMDCRGAYDDVVLEHYPLRSLNSYLVKMFRGDVVVKGKMVSQRYWRMRNRQSDHTSTLERQQIGFQKAYADLIADEELSLLHEASCKAHEDRIAELLKDPVFQKRKKWVFAECW